MSEIIQSNRYDQILNTNATLTLPNPIVVGNIILVAISGGTGTGYENVTMTDNLGNTYVRGCLSQSDFGWVVFYAYVTTGGSVTVTTHNTLGDGNAGGFIFETQGNGRTFSSAQAIIATLDNGPLPVGHANGRRTSPMTPSGDSAVFSFLYKAGGLDEVASGSGDTFVEYSKGSFPAQAALFEQYFSGTGDAYIPKLYGGASGTVPQAGGNIAVICFSKPLARPGGMVAQYAINPGRGYDDRNLPDPIDSSTIGFGAGGKTQRRCHAIFPYPVLAGSLIYAVFTQGILNLPDGYTITVTDTYGNTYHPITGAVDSGNGSVQGFYTFATNLPAAGVNFRIDAVITGPFGPGFVHQTPGLFIVERSDITSGTPAGTNVLSTVAVTDGYNVTTKSLTVPGPSLLTAVFALAATAWTALESYTIRSHWDIETLPDPSSGIFAAMPQIALEDKIVAAGTYDAKIFGTSLSSGDGTAVLIAIPLSLVTACPTGGGSAQVGVAYSKFLQASGGVAPYTWAITGGALPPGLTLNTVTGEISGTPTVAGIYNYTATATDSIGTTQPVSCSITVTNPQGIRRGMSILTAKQFATIREKHLRSHMPTDIYLDHEFPNAGFHVWPVPIGTPQIEFYYWAVLQQFAALDSQISFPPGYYDALVFNLALMLTSAYNRPATPELRALADNGKRLIQEMNAQIIAGSYHQARTLLGPNIGDLQPAAIAPDPKNPPMPGSSPVIVKP